MASLDKFDQQFKEKCQSYIDFEKIERKELEMKKIAQNIFHKELVHKKII